MSKSNVEYIVLYQVSHKSPNSSGFASYSTIQQAYQFITKLGFEMTCIQPCHPSSKQRAQKSMIYFNKLLKTLSKFAYLKIYQRNCDTQEQMTSPIEFISGYLEYMRKLAEESNNFHQQLNQEDNLRKFITICQPQIAQEQNKAEKK